jgi:hypothetical protein
MASAAIEVVNSSELDKSVATSKLGCKSLIDAFLFKGAQAQGVNLNSFPEMIVTGYSVEDLAPPSFQAAVYQ